MNVRSTSGISLGKVVSAGPQFFLVEKGIFFPKDHELRYEGIAEIGDNEILYKLSQETSDTWTKTELAAGKELRVPLMEEQVVVEKMTKEAGDVRIHKNVIAEERQVTIPLRHEEVIVERRPVRPTETNVSAHAFEEERYSIPLHEEAFEVKTRPVVREEVSVRCVAHEEQRTASATVRHEELEVEDRSTNLPGGSKETRRL